MVDNNRWLSHWRARTATCHHRYNRRTPKTNWVHPRLDCKVTPPPPISRMPCPQKTREKAVERPKASSTRTPNRQLSWASSRAPMISQKETWADKSRYHRCLLRALFSQLNRLCQTAKESEEISNKFKTWWNTTSSSSRVPLTFKQINWINMHLKR